MGDKINILCGCDDKFAQHCGVMLCSMFENTSHKGEIKVFIIDMGITKENKIKLSYLVKQYSGHSIKFLKINLENVKIDTGKYSKAVLGRLFTFSHLNVNKIVYLDSDVIVRKEIKELYDTELGGKIIGAVPDEESNRERFDYLGIPKGHKYFNSGVLLVDVQKWKDKEIDKKIEKEISKGRQFMKVYDYPDQDILNIVLYDDWKELNAGWNILSKAYNNNVLRKSWRLSRKEFNEVIKDPPIIHCADKPWENLLSFNPFRGEYFRYIKKTPWADFIDPLENAGRDLKVKRSIRRTHLFLRNLFPLEVRRFVLRSPKIILRGLVKGTNIILIPVNRQIMKPNKERQAIIEAKRVFRDKEVVACEIGVLEGEHAEDILKNLNIKKLYLIDPYEKYLGYEKDGSYDKIIKAKKVAKNRLRKYESKIVWIEKYSEDAVRDVPDNLDFLYIDGNHFHPYIDKDIKNYSKKVKEGGIISGHDYHSGFSDVMEAVFDFSKKMNGPAILGYGSDWVFLKL